MPQRLPGHRPWRIVEQSLLGKRSVGQGFQVFSVVSERVEAIRNTRGLHQGDQAARQHLSPLGRQGAPDVYPERFRCA